MPIIIAISLVLLNAFFVAAEYALIECKLSRIDYLRSKGRAFAKLVRGQLKNNEKYVSVCQFGRSVASVALGWLGIAAFRDLFSTPSLPEFLPLLFSFFIVSLLHLVLGQQVPKVLAIIRPESVALACALPLRVFSVVFSPIILFYTLISRGILSLVGISEFVTHEKSHTEEEIRALLSRAHLRGQLTRTEHRLLNAVFEFDDRIVREIMIPKREVIFLESEDTADKMLEVIRGSKHSRYPYAHGSLDEVEGVVHVKDLIGIDIGEDFDFKAILRPPHKVPEALEIGKLLRQFQATKQHMAFVMDEFGNVIGAVTMENVIEQIVGTVQDEFDVEDPLIVPEQNGIFLVDGGISLEELEKSLTCDFEETEADTLSGYLTFKLEQLPKTGDEIRLGAYMAEVVEALDSCAEKVRLTKIDKDEAEA